MVAQDPNFQDIDLEGKEITALFPYGRIFWKPAHYSYIYRVHVK
jgi:hypothetical protein